MWGKEGRPETTWFEICEDATMCVLGRDGTRLKKKKAVRGTVDQGSLSNCPQEIHGQKGVL